MKQMYLFILRTMIPRALDDEQISFHVSGKDAGDAIRLARATWNLAPTLRLVPIAQYPELVAW